MDVNESLAAHIYKSNLFEQEEGFNKKSLAINNLEILAQLWIQKFRPNNVECPPDYTECRIFCQGSTVMGVSFHQSDVDAVLVVPSFVQRSDFFDSFFTQLESHPDVDSALAIQDTFVPLIKMRFQGVWVDLVVCRLIKPWVPCHLNFKGPALLDLYRDMDPICIRCLSGVHLTHTLLGSVKSSNVIMFRSALRALRTWVKMRRLGDYVYGFPSSVAWTIMLIYVYRKLTKTDNTAIEEEEPLSTWLDESTTAKALNREYQVVQEMDELTAANLVRAFFRIFGHWNWPAPIMIGPIRKAPELGIYSWDPRRNLNDDYDVMPIITPVLPNKNAAFTARLTTRDTVTEECLRAEKIVDNIFRLRASWSDFFEKYDIMKHYRHFIKIELINLSGHQLTRIGGLLDARLRDFAQLLEDDPSVKSARIFSVDPLLTSPHHQESASSTLSADSGVSCGDSDHLDKKIIIQSSKDSWLIGMDLLIPQKNVDGKKPAKLNIDITEKINAFYRILADKNEYVDFSSVLKLSYCNNKQMKKT